MNIHSWRFRVWLTMAVFAGLGGILLGQSATGSITGTVKDSTGAVIPGATVTVTNPANKVTETATSGDDGVFVLPQLPPGKYTVTAELPGFKKAEKTDVFLTPTTKLNAGDFVLEVGAVNEAVTVSADTGQLQIKSESGEKSDLITNVQIKDLALNGRNMLDLLKTVPGIVSTVNGQVSGPGGLGSFNINGTRGNQHEFVIDGSSDVDTGSNGTLHVTVNPDAVSEAKILTSNYQAEYGKAGGGFIQLVTKSGTNNFHGTGRFFHRHEGLNANNFFRNAEGRRPDGTEIQPRSLYRYNYFGYDVGGPVWIPGLKFNKDKDKLFFFWNQEFYRQLVPGGARNIRVPSLAERNGDFSQAVDGNGNKIFIRDPLKTGNCSASDQTACFPGNIISRDRWFKDGQAILKVFPEPNFPGENRFNYTSSLSNPYPRREDVLRIDYNISEKTRLMARMINNDDLQLLPYGTFASGLNFPLTRIVFPQPGINASITLSHTFSPTLTNEFIFGPSRNRLTLEAEDDKAFSKTQNITFPLLFANVNNGYLPNFTFGGVSNIAGFPNTSFNGLPFKNVNHTFNFIDNVSKVWGLHVTKAGIFAQRSRKNQTSFGPINANINFSHDTANPLTTGHPYANALLGIYNTYQQANNFLTGQYRYWNVEGYVQDTWKVTPRFTLDYGLRLSWYEPQFDDRHQTGVFNPSLFDRSKAVRLYEPILVGSATRAVDPASKPATPSASNTLAGNFIGLIVPGSGDIANGIGRTNQGYPKGGFDDNGLLWGPRIGFAYNIFGDRKTVLRGGFGISYDRIQGNQAFDMITAPPAILTPTLFFGRLEELGAGGGALAPPNVFGYAKDGKIPTVYSTSLGVQRDVGFGTVVEIGYVGTLSRHLNQQRNLNAIPYLATFLRENQDPTRFAGGVVPEVEPNLPQAYVNAGFKFSGNLAKRREFMRPFPGYGDIAFREDVGSANYHSLQVSANRRFSRSLNFGIAYTWSKTMDTANGDGEYTNPYNTRAYDYRLASFDRTHIFVANYVYNLPKVAHYLGDNWLLKGILDNWQISGISQFVSGSPFELGIGITGVNAGQRITGSYTEGPRFYLRSNPRGGPNGLLIDPNAFVLPKIGDIAPWPRTYLRNPGINNHDISLFKNFPLSGEESRYLQMRFEMFNAFNHTQFSGINAGTNLATATAATGNAIFNDYPNVAITNTLRPAANSLPLGRFFGEYNGARDPRIIQLGVKVYF